MGGDFSLNNRQQNCPITIEKGFTVLPNINTLSDTRC